MSSISSVPARVQPRIYESVHHGNRVILYDIDNAYPTRTKRILKSSPTGVACANLLARFITGKGFENQDFNNQIVNTKGQKIKQLLRLAAIDFSYHKYFAFHVNYNLNYEISSVTRIDPEYVRLGLRDSNGFSPKVVLWDNWSYDNFARAESHRVQDEINVFNPDPKAVAMQIEKAGGINHYKGQVFVYWGEEQTYPETIYDSVLNDLTVEGKISEKNLSDVENDFAATTVFTFSEELTDEARTAKLGHLRQSQGSNGKRIFLVDGVGEGGFDMHQVQKNFSDRQFEHTEQTSRRRIIRAFSQLPILHGEDRANAISADGQAIQIAYEFYNKQTVDFRECFEESFKTVFQAFKYPINPQENYSIVPLNFTDSNKTDNVNQESDSREGGLGE